MTRITLTKRVLTRRRNHYGEQGLYCTCGCGHRFTVGEQTESRTISSHRGGKTKWYVPKHWDERSI